MTEFHDHETAKRALIEVYLHYWNWFQVRERVHLNPRTWVDDAIRSKNSRSEKWATSLDR